MDTGLLASKRRALRHYAPVRKRMALKHHTLTLDPDCSSSSSSSWLWLSCRVLVLSAYAVYLMVVTKSRMGELAGGSEVERTYLEEMRQRKTLLQQYLDLSQRHCS